MKKNKFADLLATITLTLAGITILGILTAFIFYILKRGLPVLTPSFIFGPPSEMETGGGVGPELFNTFYILALSLVFSLPVGLGAGIWLAEYANPGRVVNIIRTSTEMLATVPSIVFGLFGMIIFVNFLGLGFTIIGGALTLSLLNLPVLIRVTEEAVRAVPKSYRMASLALGATKSQTLFRVVLPAALPRIITGVTLVAGRAIGESAILIFTAGTTVSRFLFDLNPFASGETLAVHLWYVNSEGLIPDATRIADGSAALLLILVLIFNLLLVIPTKRYEKKVKLN